ncbi:MAG: dTDP-4-dehydrorhamnose 3,5-epimerase family protein [Dethiobacter sp.]|jgi:dTDP-4-dehydrorhamnose 3,5-epimerase|nr:dTDP-4-dehydrorhamnose 3,5-epimerase family protein [Dethiobacter sp.]
MIKGVKVKGLKKIPDERGCLVEILRCDDKQFLNFGQVYMTSCYPGVVKGWHFHKLQTDNMCVVKGMAKIVLYDRREDSETKGEINEFFMGDRNPLLLSIPPEIAHGIKAIGTEEALVINVPDYPYNYDNPDDYRVPPHTRDIPYEWVRKDG